jgi:hypothetical protein
MKTKVKKISFKALVTRKSEEFLLDGIPEPVRIREIKNGQVYFSGKDKAGKVKDHKMATVDFLKFVNDRLVKDALKVDQAPEPTPPADITAEILSKGFRWCEKLGGPEKEISKFSLEAVTYATLSDLEDPVKSKEPGVYTTLKMAEFLLYINEVTRSVYKESLKKPPVKSAKEIQKTITTKNSSESLAVILSEDERNKAARRSADLQKEIEDKEGAKKAYVSQIGGEIKELKARLATLTTKVVSGKEFCDVQIKIIYRWKENRKIVTRLDTGEILRESAIPVHELQNTFLRE